MNKLLINLDVNKKHGKSQPVISHIALMVAWLTYLSLLLFCSIGCAKISSSDTITSYESLPSTPVRTFDYANTAHVSGFTGTSEKAFSDNYIGSSAFGLRTMEQPIMGSSPDCSNAPHVSGFTGISSPDVCSIRGSISFAPIMTSDCVNAPHVSGFTGIGPLY